MTKNSSSKKNCDVSKQGLLIDVIVFFGALVFLPPLTRISTTTTTSTSSLSSLPTIMTIVLYFVLFFFGSVILDKFEVPTAKIANQSRKPAEFKNTIMSLANAVLLAYLFLQGFCRGLLSLNWDSFDSVLDSKEAFTNAIFASISVVVPLAIGYLAYDVWDMWRKNLLSTFLLVHHVGASTPAAIWMFNQEFGSLTRAILLIVSCEINSVFLHARRLLKLYPGGSETKIYPIVHHLLNVTLVIFRLCTSFGYLALLLITSVRDSIWNMTTIDVIVLIGLAVFAHHNFTLAKRAFFPTKTKSK